MTLWQKRDPRATTFFAIAISLSLVLIPPVRAWFFLPLVIFLLVGAGVTRSTFVALLRAVFALWLLSFVFNALLIPGPRVGPEWLGPVRPTSTGLRAGLDHGARLAGLAGLGTWLATTTSVLDLAASLEWMTRGIPPVRRTLHRALLPVVLAVRLVPLLVDEGRRLLEVDRLRRGPQGRLRAFLRLARLAPLWMVLVVERAEILAQALVLRGYDPERERGFARAYRFAVIDWMLVIVGTLTLVGSVV